MNFKKPLGLKIVPLIVAITLVVFFFAVKIGLGPSTDNSGIDDALALIIAIIFSFIFGLIIAIIILFGKNQK